MPHSKGYNLYSPSLEGTSFYSPPLEGLGVGPSVTKSGQDDRAPSGNHTHP